MYLLTNKQSSVNKGCVRYRRSHEALPGKYKVTCKVLQLLPLISVEDEIELAKLIEAGSEEAREKLIIANLKLVVKIAHDYKSLEVPLADLISEGNIGLRKAVEKFRPGHGAKFSSYGAW